MTGKGYIICTYSFLAIIWFSGFSARALTPKEQKGVKVLKSPTVVYEAPDWVLPTSLISASEDIDFWKRILPFTGGRDAKRYIVIPTLGLIAPIQEVPSGSTDYTKMFQGEEIKINTYLINGVMHYPGTAMPGQLGNIVIFGHSNYLKYGHGDYKTIFADLMNLDVGPYDEIRLYQQQLNGSYTLLKYEIEQSYETHPQDVDVLLPTIGEELTVFACTNGIQGRRIVKARRIPDDELFVPYEIKFRRYEAIQKLVTKDPIQQESIRNQVLTALETKRVRTGLELPTEKTNTRQYLLQYLEKKLIN